MLAEWVLLTAMNVAVPMKSREACATAAAYRVLGSDKGFVVTVWKAICINTNTGEIIFPKEGESK